MSDVVILDDIYDSGATLNKVCESLLTDLNIKSIYVIAITKRK